MQASALYHPDYSDQATLWSAIEDVCDGGRQVKRRGKLYLPSLSDQTDEEYKTYLLRAVFFNATKKTREAMVGMLLRKPAKITIPKEIEALTSDIDLEGGTVKNWIRTVVQQIVSTGRGVTVADWNDEEQRPFLAFYPAVNFCNWATERVKGRRELSLIVLKEISEERSGSTVGKKESFREYSLKDGLVWCKVWTVGTGQEITAGDEMPVTRKGKQLTRIPVVIHNATHLGARTGEAPLADIADLNIAHFMGSADLENGRHICGIPTPYATGVEDDDKNPLKLGSTKAWTANDPQAKFGFIEFNGQGLDALVKGQEEKVAMMATLGARMMFDMKKDAEAFETVKLRADAETASLSNMAGFLSATLTQAIRWFIWWESTAETIADLDDSFGILVNDDFVDTPLDSTTLSGLVTAFQADAISFETFYHQLQKGEIYPEDWDLEKEVAAIGQRPPATVPKVVKPDPGVDPAKKNAA